MEAITHYTKFEMKPFSANKMYYRDKRRRTVDYNRFTDAMLLVLQENPWEFQSSELVEVVVNTFVSNKLSDLDNFIKPILDCYQAAYPEFNDRYVMKINMEKTYCPSGEEYFEVYVNGRETDELK